ncbi:hypothetical protein JO972_08705 [Verrucomicrobiaceae bacterium 5K15]|uniref:PEP-CTERM protein-sorting domain-containing protein n=1 Tax=Oceaniferula flava TaxID=2800421 RepID=A0AAE2SEV3_9BACT|nr:hypothetical protein [Oceaniferula flavus]MBK1855036.1 hypothetical protein [Oceaniferula flavus]MBM1136342.1 hypothetical protein [Oceaniferula flavus]
MKKDNIRNLLLITTSALMCSSPLYGSLVIYEPFDDLDDPLTGNSTGLGLDGTWATNDNAFEVAGGLTYGSLVVSGGSAKRTADARAGASASISSSALSGTGLLDDGATLWFSVLVGADPSLGSNDRWVMSLGTGTIHSGNVGMSGSGSGIGFVINGSNGGALSATTWSGGDETLEDSTTNMLTAGETSLIVGKITWGIGGSDDTIDLFVVGTDLTLPALADSSGSAALDQSTFDTLAFAGKDQTQFDEIRFGTSYDEVVVTAIPEPSSSTFVGLTGFALLLRRRR